MRPVQTLHSSLAAAARPQSRRAFLSVMTASAALLGARRLHTSTRTRAGESLVDDFAEITLNLEDRRGAPRRAVVYLRDPGSARERRALVLLHGYGQAASERRALAAWRQDYGLLESYAWLAAPPLVTPRQARFVSEARLAELNAELSDRRLGDMMFICPITPVPYHGGRAQTLDRFAEFVEDRLLPEVGRLARVGAVGLAGVSMGGQVGLELLVRKPALFRAFTGILADVEVAEATVVADRIHAAIERSHRMPLYILSAQSDVYRAGNERLLRELRARGLEVDHRCPPGVHADAWLREIGCAEMLIWQDRALASRA